MNIELGNYTGPYWSDGKLQTSVLFGESNAIDALDGLSRLHDSAYAFFPDAAHREAADMWYNEHAKQISGAFPQLAGNIVEYGNYAGRQAEKLAKDVTQYAFIPGFGPIFGAAKFVAENIMNSNKMINGTYLKKEREDLETLFAQDPLRKQYVAPAGAVDLPTSRKQQSIPPTGKKPMMSYGHVRPVRKSGSVGPDVVSGPNVSDIRNAELVGRQKEKIETYNQKYKNAVESNPNFANQRLVQRSVDRVEKGRLSRAVQGKKKNKKKFNKNKVVPQ
jgi:hypothetical protein